MSCMWSTKLRVPAGALAQLIAGDVPSRGAAPSAAWLNLTGIWPPSGNPGIVSVMGRAAGAAPRWPPRSCAAIGSATSITIDDTMNDRPGCMSFLLEVRVRAHAVDEARRLQPRVSVLRPD